MATALYTSIHTHGNRTVYMNIYTHGNRTVHINTPTDTNTNTAAIIYGRRNRYT